MDLFQNWGDNLASVSVIMALTSWFITGMFWRPRLPLLIRVPIVFVLVVIFMVVLGAISALIVSLPLIPDGNLMGAFTYEFTATFSLFTQMGLETVLLWLPVVITRILILTIHLRRQSLGREL